MTAADGDRRRLREVLARATPADLSDSVPSMLVPVAGDTFLRLSRRAHHALALHAGGAELPAVAAATAGPDASWTADRLTRIRDHLMARADGAGPPPDSVGFYLRRSLIPARIVGRVAATLRVLFRPALACVAVAAAIATLVASWDGIVVSPSELALGYLWMVGSLVAHELGHAAAAAYFGCRPGPIGFTFYVIYPALYSDVTAAWTLQRSQRIVVDLGGVYFQLLYAALLAASTVLFEVHGAAAGLAMIALSMLVSLNPFLKFDGYWVLADALGVANLAAQRRRALRAIGAFVLRRPRDPSPWRPRVAIVLGCYAAATAVFTVLLAVYLLPAMVRALVAYPALVHDAVMDIVEHGVPRDGAPWLALGSATLLLYFGVHMLRRLVRSLRRPAGRVDGSGGRPGTVPPRAAGRQPADPSLEPPHP